MSKRLVYDAGPPLMIFLCLLVIALNHTSSWRHALLIAGGGALLTAIAELILDIRDEKREL